MCPSIPLQLAGGKKVQQVLAAPGVLERFTPDWSAEQRAEIRASWVDMWGLEAYSTSHALDGDGLPPPLVTEEGGEESEGVQRARAEHMDLVLKPQREGGGNNVYRASIPPFLRALPPGERAAWVAMRLIRPPARAGLLLRAGEAPRRCGVVSELGVFGWALFGEGTEVREEECGWLVRTKAEDEDEGGVAAGFSVLDGIVLTD
jgi:hypothetical protein